MRENIVINNVNNLSSEEIKSLLKNFEVDGELIGDGGRNVIKTLIYNDKKYNVKAFKEPNVINKIIYKFFRKSKAQRSYEYAYKLLKLGFNTPNPVAFIEYSSFFVFKTSFYITEHLNYDFTIRKLIDEPKCEDYDNILRAFTRFTFNLHESNINFLDHSPGNTLIMKQGDEYKFYLVDLNRMRFENMDFDMRMNNFARLSPKDYMLDVISDEYAKLINEPVAKVRERMYYFSNKFSTSFKKREAFKKKYFFWRKKR